MDNSIYTCQDAITLRHYFKMGESLTNAEIEKLLWTAEFTTGELEHILMQEAEAIEGTIPSCRRGLMSNVERIRALKRLCEALLGESFGERATEVGGEG